MRSYRVTLTLICFSFFFSFIQANTAVLNYIDKYSGIAVQEMHRVGIPASITLAQGIIESRYGMSGLAKNSNNHFGIKCKGNWQGGKYFHKDDDYVDGKLIKSCFRTYESPEESYYDHSEFLLVNKRYHFLFKLEKSNYKGWAKGLKKAGYATAKDYATTLINTIEKYELYQYDQVKEERLLAVEGTDLIPPKAEKIPEYINFDNAGYYPATTNAETLVAMAPPKATLLPADYQAGDGLNTPNKVKTTNHLYLANNNAKRNRSSFQEDIYGNSSLYLEEISPQSVGRD